MKKIYRFTNENLTSFDNIYNFSNAKVLSVVGSGDQYFTSLLNGAKEIELYDNNDLAWDYFLLKYYSILTLSYEEFFDYFVIKKLDDYSYFEKIKKYLSPYIAYKIGKLYNKNKQISYLFEYENMEYNYNDGIYIPYLNIENYHKLQTMLSKSKVPVFHPSSFSNLSKQLSSKYYDIIIASNIFYNLNFKEEINKVSEYKELLNKFNYSEFQAIYSWWLNNDLKQKLLENNFEINEVKSTMKLKLTNDCVISLKKK